MTVRKPPVGPICRLVSERLHLLPPLRWRLTAVPLGVDLPYWVEDPDFDLDFHIRESAVPPPGDDRKLAETVARIFARPLDRGRPLWEIYVIHGLPDGNVALLTKIHHAVVDGVSGNEILTVLLDPSPEGREIPPDLTPPRRQRMPNDLELLGRGVLGLPKQPLRVLRSIPTTLPNVTELPGVAALPGGRRSATRSGGCAARSPSGTRRCSKRRRPGRRARRSTARSRPHRRFAFGELSLEAVRRLKDALGFTVNDVVVALCTSAVRRWLLDRDALPQEPLVALVPVSVRTEQERGAFGNRVSMMIVPIPTDEADTMRRLERTHELLRSAKERHMALPASLLTDATAFIPPAVAALAARTTTQLLSRTRPPVNLVISNVPGPRDPLFLSGAQLLASYPVSVVVDGVGLNITVMSYRDHLDFGIVADREQVHDAWAIIDGLRAALAEFEAAVGSGRTTDESKPRARSTTA